MKRRSVVASFVVISHAPISSWPGLSHGGGILYSKTLPWHVGPPSSASSSSSAVSITGSTGWSTSPPKFLAPSGTTSLVDAESSPDVEPGALLTRIVIPTGEKRRLVFDRSLKPVISVAAGVDGNGSGRAAFGCAFPETVCVKFDAGGDAGDIAEEISGTLPRPIQNAFAGSDYRRRMARVLLERQIVRLTEIGA